MSIILPTFQQLYDIGKAEAQARNSRLTDWNEGSVNDAWVGGGAIQADETIRVLIALFARQFVDTATDDDLDALALDRFGLTRLPESASVGILRFSRGSSVGVLTIPAGTTCKATISGVAVTFTTDEEAEMPAASTTVEVAATCTETGRTGNIAALTITTLVDAIPGDSTATVTNPNRFAGGALAETDAAFRDRIRRYFGTLRKGTVEALEAGALSVPGVSFAVVDESTVSIGFVSLYIGDPDANSNDTLQELVAQELENWRAAGIQVMVFGAVREEIDLAITIYIKSSTDQDALRTAIRSAVFAYTDGLKPSEKLYLAQVVATVIGASSQVVSCAVSDPITDLEPDEIYNALRVSSENLSLSFVVI